ncbi:DUF1707 domain-containing protein [Streptomyces sp. ICBB 8177]|uniref:DUF1707 domain-containing protein n=1 Tax=Streptomyces sp. ICBB 8177 TaxID=563922 RepID=UPI000D67AA6D|nr:DUF1707 domain-containing protein [Streptomyces sp. ICBB 8177]PWI42710.1 hypothetical protein CK485_10410 [Streptomyces sp. ICBB 8177]
MSSTAVPAPGSDSGSPADVGARRPRLAKLPGAAPDLRASDEERDQVAGILADALATGRLAPDEHAERLEAVYAARTRGELAPLTQDLPEPAEGRTALARHLDAAPVHAVFSKIRRGGQWPVPPETVVRSTFGAAVIDLRHAVFTRHEVVIHAHSFCGKIEILVPDNARVHDTGTALFGKRSLPGGREAEGDDGPVVRITGRSLFGHVRVMRGGFKWPWREWR